MASADGMRFVRQSEQSMPDRTANTLVITEDHPVQLCVRSVFRLSWHRYTGDAEDSIFVLEGLLEQETGLNPTGNYDRYSRCQRTCLWPFLAAGIPVFSRPADAGASVFWRMDHDADYGVLNDIARGHQIPEK